MLVLSRKLNEVICIGGNVRIMVVGIRGDRVRLGIEAPETVPVLREEVAQDAIHQGAMIPDVGIIGRAH